MICTHGGITFNYRLTSKIGEILVGEMQCHYCLGFNQDVTTETRMFVMAGKYISL